ncbi:acyltransferase family protein [Marinicella sp. W31]|uniref:acyltransferase family protein n=1 Tax=Marinicella sp. W31 TaxID=3023713 RepID=UPI0037569CB6
MNNSNQQSAIRYHYMDNLRALAMLMGIFFHAALAYSPITHFVWLTAEKEKSVSLDVIAWFTHLFRMPLFFLIAGFFALYLIEKRGLPRFLKNRGLRVLLPLLIFLPLVLWSIKAGIEWALVHVDNPSLLLQFIGLAKNNPDAPKPPFSMGHLWFLYNLAMFYVVFVVLWKLRFFDSVWVKKMMSRSFILLILPVLVIPAFFSQAAPHPAPEGIMPQWWSFAFYGVLFIVGACIYKHQAILEDLQRFKYVLLILSLLAYAYLYGLFPAMLSIGSSWYHFKVAALEAFIAVYMTVCCLSFGAQLLNQANGVFRYFADASYWIYIIHIPLLFLIQYQLMDVEWFSWIEFLIASCLTIAIGLITYALLVRRTPIGLLLNGKMIRKKQMD